MLSAAPGRCWTTDKKRISQCFTGMGERIKSSIGHHVVSQTKDAPLMNPSHKLTDISNKTY